MDYFNKILILKTFHDKYNNNNDNNDNNNAKKILLQIKNLHGKIIEYILDLKESQEDNKLELLSDLECINFKIINIINNCNKDNKEVKEDKEDKEDKEVFIDIADKEEEEIINIVDKRKLHKNLSSLILFHAEWCGHCKQLMPIWDALEKIIPDNKLNIVKISCVKKEEICKSLNIIKGYPTIIFVNSKKNELIVFDAERTIENIIIFINENSECELVKIE